MSEKREVVKVIDLKKENARLKRLLIATARHLEIWLDNTVGSVEGCDSDDYMKAHKKSMDFLNKHFK